MAKSQELAPIDPTANPDREYLEILAKGLIAMHEHNQKPRRRRPEVTGAQTVVPSDSERRRILREGIKALAEQRVKTRVKTVRPIK